MEIGNNIMKSVWNGKNNQIVFCLIFIAFIFLTACDDYPLHPGEGFYSYRGYRDWWRTPLYFPYQVTNIDTFDYGTIEKYDPSSRIADPGCEILVTGVTEIGCNEKFAVFRNKDILRPFGILLFSTSSIKFFETEKALADFVNANFPSVDLPAGMDLEKFYHLRWQEIENRKEPDPKKTAAGRNITTFCKQKGKYLFDLSRKFYRKSVKYLKRIFAE